MKRKQQKSFTILLILMMALGLLLGMGTTAAAYDVVDGVTTVSSLDDLIVALEDERISEIIVSDAIVLPDDTNLYGYESKTVRAAITGVDESGVVQSGSNHSIFTVASGSTVSINDMTIMGGSATAIVNGGTLTMENVVVTRSGNPNELHGGIHNTGTLILKDCSIIRNVAQGAGGISNEKTLIMDGCSISENRALGSDNGGGGMENSGGDAVMYINNCVISNNTTLEAGGGINNNGGTIYMMNSTVTGNATTKGNALYGGGIGNNSGTLYAVNSIINDNSSCDIALSISHNSDIGHLGSDKSLIRSYLYNCIYGKLQLDGDTLDADIDNQNITAETIFDAYRFAGVLAADGSTSYLYTCPVLIPTDGGRLYAPLAANSPAASGGVATHFSYNDDGTNIKMSYTLSGGTETALGNLGTGGESVITYIEGGARADGVIGASGTSDTTTYYTVSVTPTTGGTVSGATVYGDSYAFGDSVTVTAIADENHHFEKWTAGGAQVSTDKQYTFQVAGDTTLTPVFAQGARYSVTYSGNNHDGGSVPVDLTDYEDNDTVTVLGNTDNLTKTGYTCQGWNTQRDGSGTTYTATQTFSITSNTTLYAKWTPITYTVAYNGNGATGGSTASSSHTYDVAKALTSNGFEREYTVTYIYYAGSTGDYEVTATYDFKEWDTQADGEGTPYANGDEVTNLSDTQNATVTLYAQWSGGAISLDTPTRDGYTFDGWYDDELCNNKAGDGGASYQPTQNTTLYAKWSPIPAVSPGLSGANPTALNYGYTTGGEMRVEIDNEDENTYEYAYKWYKGGSNDIRDENLIANANTASYDIPKGLNAGQHKYTVRVTAKRTDNENEAASHHTFTVTVNKAEVTFTGETGTLTYTGSDIELTGIKQSGLLGGHTYEGLTYSAKGKNVGDYDGTFAGTVKIMDGNTDVTGNYDVTQTPGLLTVENAEIAVTFTGASGTRTYTGGETELTGITPSGLLTGHTYSGLTYSAKGKNVGEYDGTFTGTVVIKDGDVDVTENYAVTQTPGVLTITNASIAVTFTGESGNRTYSGVETELTGITASGLLDGHDYEGLTYSAKGKNVGGYDGAFTGTVVIKDEEGTDVTANYAVTPTPGKLTITTATLTVKVAAALTNITKTYDGETTVDSAASTWLEVVGLKNGETATASGTWAYADANAGIGKTVNVTGITIDYDTATASNYSYTQVTLSPAIGVINPAAITPTLTPYTGQFDGGEHGISLTASTINDQTIDIKYRLEATGEYNLEENPTFRDADTYTVYYKISAPNHSDLEGSGTVTIDPKSIAAVWDGVTTFTYDGEAHAPTATVQTGVDSETVTLTVTGGATDYRATTYTATAAISGAVGDNAKVENYTLTNTQKDFTITQRPFAVQWLNMTQVFTGQPLRPDFGYAGILAGDAGGVTAALDAAQNPINAGTHTLTATLDGSRANNYSLTNPTGNFTIQKAPVSFTVSDDYYAYDGGAKSATITATATGGGHIDFDIYYFDSKGDAVPAPRDVGSYEIHAVINDGNYRHAGAADGAAMKIGVLTIYRAAPPATYTLSFDGGDGAIGTITPLAAAQAGTIRVLPEGYTHAGKTFTGWKYGNQIYQPGERLSQPAVDITLTAQWAENVYDIGGGVENSEGTEMSGVVVTLMLGSEQIAQTISINGSYSFNDVSPGIYNLVASRDGVIQTTLVEIKDGNAQAPKITMPAFKTNSVVEIAAGSPAIVVGKLEQVFSDEDKEAAEDEGKTVEVKLNATATTATGTEEQTAIDSAAAGTVGIFLDVEITKTVDSVPQPSITETPVLLEIVVNLPGELQGKANYTVYRSHGDVVGKLTTTPNIDGEYIEVNAARTAITVYAKFFSTYAIAYTESAPSGGGGTVSTYKPIIIKSPNGAVSVRPAATTAGSTVTVTITPDEGYELDTLVITDRNGKEVTVTDKGDGNFTFTQPIGAVTITAAFKPVTERLPWNPFTDVTEEHWFHDDVKYVYEKGLMVGTAEDKFSPLLPTTRAMIVTILWRMEGEPVVNYAMNFSDVAEDEYYTEAVRWAASEKIVEGYGDGSFGPDDKITREQMATILYRYAAFKGYDVSAAADLSIFADCNKISAWALDAMRWANAEGLINGIGNDLLDPLGYAQRSQVAAILHRFCEKIVK